MNLLKNYAFLILLRRYGILGIGWWGGKNVFKIILAFNLCISSVQAIAQGTVKCNFAGVALGDSWISPLGRYHSVFTTPRPCYMFPNENNPAGMLHIWMSEGSRWYLRNCQIPCTLHSGIAFMSISAVGCVSKESAQVIFTVGLLSLNLQYVTKLLLTLQLTKSTCVRTKQLLNSSNHTSIIFCCIF